MIRRGLSIPSKPTQSVKAINNFLNTLELKEVDFHTADATFVVQYLNNPAEIISSIEDGNNFSEEFKFKAYILDLIYTLFLKDTNAINILKDKLIKTFGLTNAELKEFIKNKILSNSTLVKKIQQCLELA
jgi:phosphopantetheine adenylyltransferase